ncbi:MAG TPA: hypothetical protein VHD32_10940 [Candidatus Didemnitutus sp.]|nr:hypothetical protein [Candidatus Didemnitutus sp.]
MRRLLAILLVAFAIPEIRADSVAFALQARALLGPGHWSQVIEIDDSTADAHHPLRFHALLFELEDRLWLYDSHEGTQSLSVIEGHLEADEADPSPLLRRALPHFRRFRDVTRTVGDPPTAVESTGPCSRLPFGCFMECAARWREMRHGANPPDFGGILAFYFDTGAGRCGHSVLVYTQGGRRHVYDPDDYARNDPSPTSAIGSPLLLAREYFPLQRPNEAHLLALHDDPAKPRPPLPSIAAAGLN